MTARTPISYLLEVSSRRGITPQYDLIATEGRVHEPTFVFRCTAGPFTFTGKGTNKKIARHEAAYGVLQQMLASERSAEHPEMYDPCTLLSGGHGQVASVLGVYVWDGYWVRTVQECGMYCERFRPFLPPRMTIPKCRIPSVNYKKYSVIILRDPNLHVTLTFQEIAQKNKWMPPTYEYEVESETKDFVCVVTMAKMEERGIGRSKKAAKKTAAKNLLRAVLEHPDNIPEDMKIEEEEEEELPLSTESVVIPPTRGNQEEEDAQTLEEISEPHMVGLRLRNPKGSAVVKLKTTDLNELEQNFVDQLRELSEEQNWIIQYHELPSPGDDQYLMLVEVAKLKPHTAVYHGEGKTQDKCKNRAARNMLDYIKKMILTDEEREA